MIKLSSLNKYFFKGKKNELHVINDVCLQLPDTGFVVILGKSGSGKTTLLNVIGGLDKFSGAINYDDKELFTSYKMSKMDAFRSGHIGYIFQNFLLLNDETVWNNLDLSLKIFGIDSKDERRKRINASLKAVNMLRYRRKNASALSGGQKQRVAIARALSKLPNIIIADEPTGNLDSENSLQIMRILSDFSDKRLILMVTHNEELARNFADRIITYADGKIVDDKINTAKSVTLNLKSSSSVYLDELKKSDINKDGLSINLFTDSKTPTSIFIKIIEHDGKAYLYADDDKVKFNDTSLNIKESKVEEKKEEIEKTTFEYEDFEKVKRTPISLLSLFKNSFKSFFSKSKFKTKAFRFLMFILGIGATIISISAYGIFNSTDYLKTKNVLPTSSLVVVGRTQTYSYLSSQDYIAALKDKDNSGVTGILMSASVNGYCFEMGKTLTNSNTVNAFVDYNPITGQEIKVNYLYGKEAESYQEIALSKTLIDMVMPDLTSKGYSYQDLIGTEFYLPNSDKSYPYSMRRFIYNSSYDYTPRIVGISDDDKPYIHVSEKYGETMLSILLNYKNHSSSDSITVCNDYDYYTYKIKSEIDPSLITSFGVERDEALVNGYFSSSAIELLKNYLPIVMKGFYNILGTYDSDDPVVVLDAEKDFSLLSLGNNDVWSYFDRYITGSPLFTYYEDKEITSGRAPNDVKEYLVPDNLGYSLDEEKGIVGLYKASGTTFNPIYASCLTTIYYNFNNLDYFSAYGASNGNGFINTLSGTYPYALYSSNIDKTISYFSSRDFVENPFAINSMSNAIESLRSQLLYSGGNLALLICFILLLLALFILTFFSSRSNMIHHIYGISVYRSIGASKGFVSKLFISDGVVNSLLTIGLGSSLAYLTYYIVMGLTNNILTSFPLFYAFLVVIGLNVLSLIGSLIPLFFLLRKTPFQIQNKYDI